MRTQVAIVGATPAELLPAPLLHRRGIGSVILKIMAAIRLSSPPGRWIGVS